MGFYTKRLQGADRETVAGFFRRTEEGIKDAFVSFLARPCALSLKVLTNAAEDHEEVSGWLRAFEREGRIEPLIIPNTRVRCPADNPDDLTVSPGIAAREYLWRAAKLAGYVHAHQYAKACLTQGATIRSPGGLALRTEAEVFEACIMGGHDLIIEWPEIVKAYSVTIKEELPPESPPAPTVTGRTPEACASRGENCNTKPCFGCPNA